MLERPISKAGWTRVAFGDVVRLSKARVTDPEAAGIERVVGLEHIEPGDLRIRRWGDVADGTTFTTLFKPGQVLFGKRRAYQRKVAVADFEGVCSGDIYVLEPANDRLMPELLPFLCQTDAFFDHAVGTSAGSLSPRTNWTSLASFEFLLPPIQQQARWVEVLNAAVEFINSLISLKAQAEYLELSTLKTIIPTAISSANAIDDESFDLPVGWRMARLSDLGRVIRGSSPRPKGDPRFYGGSVPRLMVEDISRDGMFVTPKIDTLTDEGAKLSRPVPAGTVVLVCSGNVGEPSILAIDACIHDGLLAVVDLVDDVTATFLYFAFRSIKSEFLRLTTNGGIWSNLTTDVVKEIKIAVPPKAELELVVAKLSSVNFELKTIEDRYASANTMFQSLLSEITGEGIV